MSKQIFQIQIALKGFHPKIWRRVLVSSDLLLSDFHMVIQKAMGWTNSHLHQFIKNRKFYLEKLRDDDFWVEFPNVDYKNMKISDLLTKEKEEIVYEYDFGDGWEHDIVLEKLLPEDPNQKHPICLAGEMNCPPEDCGGVWGYSNMLEVLKDPDHEEYGEYLDWLGGVFDPTFFDKNKINKALKKLTVNR